MTEGAETGGFYDIEGEFQTLTNPVRAWLTDYTGNLTDDDYFNEAYEDSYDT